MLELDVFVSLAVIRSNGASVTAMFTSVAAQLGS